MKKNKNQIAIMIILGVVILGSIAATDFGSFLIGYLNPSLTNIKVQNTPRTIPYRPGMFDVNRTVLNSQVKTDLKSEFFKSDLIAQNILNGNPYDMYSMKYEVGTPNFIDKKQYAFKIMSALKMLGYNTAAGTSGVGNMPHVLVVNQFQKNNGLISSNTIDSAFMKQLDAQLVVKEAEEKNYQKLFPLWNIIQRDPYDVSADHIAKIFSIAFQVLPAKFDLKTAEAYKTCFMRQCDVYYYDSLLNTFKDIDVTDALTVLPPDQMEIQKFIHEFGHYVDGVLTATDKQFPQQGMIDTREFYSISFIGHGDVHLLGPGELNTPRNCFYPKTNDPYEFISSYAASQSISAVECKPDWGLHAEDFAESFSAYVVHGKYFREAAKLNSKIKEKYEWLKKNVFDGIEYNTDFSSGNASGCNDLPETASQTPGYLKCKEDVVWDGTIKKL